LSYCERTALGWFKVRRYPDVPAQDEHLPILSIYGYQLAIGCFVVVKGRGWDLSDVSFWGSWSVTLFWVSLREVLFGSVGQPVGKTAASSQPWSYADARVSTELKLVWFGDFKFSLGFCISTYRSACLTSVSQIRRWSDVGIGGWGRGCLLLVYRSVLFVC